MRRWKGKHVEFRGPRFETQLRISWLYKLGRAADLADLGSTAVTAGRYRYPLTSDGLGDHMKSRM